ncbi:WxL domain-containing protein [Isobaculum melis]|uniref:WxL domain surface cell wall-binding n=1 Tax=Isobaculum melis TaxID=142588 RepID=A0A1H9SQM1_9LACT|nr:WxL domain-containing protein [Isobaculum melis]SER87231.1 WxL domain surface cell wall-binding [Isobaculum melis]
MKKIVKNSALVTLALLVLSNSTQAVFADETVIDKSYNSNAVVEFEADTESTGPVDPLDPDPNNPVDPFDPTNPPTYEPDPGTGGPLGIDFASSIDFGSNKITSKDVTYYANPQYYFNADKTGPDLTRPRPNYIQVSDKRGTNAGWTLTVKQNGQLTNEETQNSVLTSAAITLANGSAVSNVEGVIAPTTYEVELNPNGDSAKVMAAAKGNGSGTWVDLFGTVEDIQDGEETVKKNKSVSLFIPGTTPIDAVKYSTSLTWTLASTPNNE